MNMYDENTNLKLEVIRPPAPLRTHGDEEHPEVWFKAQGDHGALQVEYLKTQLMPEPYKTVLKNARPAFYYPDRPQTDEEKALGAFIDWWGFTLHPWMIDKMEELGWDS